MEDAVPPARPSPRQRERSGEGKEGEPQRIARSAGVVSSARSRQAAGSDGVAELSAVFVAAARSRAATMASEGAASWVEHSSPRDMVAVS